LRLYEIFAVNGESAGKSMHGIFYWKKCRSISMGNLHL